MPRGKKGTIYHPAIETTEKKESEDSIKKTCGKTPHEAKFNQVGAIIENRVDICTHHQVTENKYVHTKVFAQKYIILFQQFFP